MEPDNRDKKSISLAASVTVKIFKEHFNNICDQSKNIPFWFEKAADFHDFHQP